MAVEIINGVEHRFPPNPMLQQDDWAAEYPPIVTNSRWLINKFTGEIVPNHPEFARRSDILEPYLGEVSEADESTAMETEVNQVLNPPPADDGELIQL